VTSHRPRRAGRAIGARWLADSRVGQPGMVSVADARRPRPGGRLAVTPALAAAAVVVVAYTAWIGLNIGGDRVTAVVDDGGAFVAAALASAAALWHARTEADRAARTGWRLLGIYLLLILLGGAYRSYYEVVLQSSAPFGAVAFLPFLAGSVMEILAILFLCGRGTGGLRPRLALDGGIVASSLLLVSWLVVLRDAYLAGGAPLDVVVGLAAPISDVLALVMLLSTLAHSRLLDPARLLVAIAVFGSACSGSTLAYLNVHGLQLGIQVADAGWFAMYLLFAVATLAESPPDLAEAQTLAPWQVALPYVPLLVASGVVAGELLSGHSLDVFAALLIAAVVVLVLVRQLMAVIETGALAARLLETAERWRVASTEREILIDHAPVGICRLSADGRLVTVNRTLERTMHLEREELEGRPLRDLVHPDDRRALAIAAGDGQTAGEVRFLCGDGSVIWCSYATVAVLGAAGAADSSIGIVEDINDRRLAADRAAAIQRQLLPRDAPSIAGYELVGTCVPAQDVAGDFYDWVLADGRVDVTLADVMGKGMGAALVTAALRTALRTAPAELGPGQRVALAAETMALGLDGLFVTVFHARLDLGTGRLRYVDAGHGHCAIRRASGDLDHLPVRSMPLGVDDGAEFPEGEVRLRPGDSLLLYSDGLVETETGTARAESLLPQLEGADDAGDLLRRLIANVLPRPADDVTAVVLRRLPGAPASPPGQGDRSPAERAARDLVRSS
jgi:PAS domain S-box-containing protein